MSWDVHTPLPCSHPPPVASDKPSGRKVRPTYMYGGSLQTVTLVAKLVGFLWLTLKTILTHLLTMLLEIVECLLLQLSLLWQCQANCNVRQICLSPLSLPGVEFSLPLASDSHPKAEKTSDTLDDSENEDESTASTWLCSMGIATQDFPAANTQTIALYPCHLKHTCVHMLHVSIDLCLGTNFTTSVGLSVQEQCSRLSAA